MIKNTILVVAMLVLSGGNPGVHSEGGVKAESGEAAAVTGSYQQVDEYLDEYVPTNLELANRVAPLLPSHVLSSEFDRLPIANLAQYDAESQRSIIKGVEWGLFELDSEGRFEGEARNTTFELKQLSAIMDAHASLVTPRGVFLGGENVPMEQLKLYDRYMEEKAIPALARSFPMLIEATRASKPIIIILQGKGEISRWYSNYQLSGYVDDFGVYSHHRLIFISSEANAKEFQSTEFVPTVLVHEYIHWLIDKLASGSIPAFMNEGIAINESHRIAERKADWQTSFTDTHWARIKASNQAAPLLWSYSFEDEWTLCSLQFMQQKYGNARIERYITSVSEQEELTDFSRVFGVTAAQFQIQFRNYVKLIRDYPRYIET